MPEMRCHQGWVGYHYFALLHQPDEFALLGLGFIGASGSVGRGCVGDQLQLETLPPFFIHSRR
jgi:hypothetical protein